MADTAPPSLADQVADLENKVSQLEAQEGLTEDGEKKLIAGLVGTFPGLSKYLIGAGTPAADADAIEGGQPAVEQQIATDQSATPNPQ